MSILRAVRVFEINISSSRFQFFFSFSFVILHQHHFISKLHNKLHEIYTFEYIFLYFFNLILVKKNKIVV